MIYCKTDYYKTLESTIHIWLGTRMLKIRRNSHAFIIQGRANIMDVSVTWRWHGKHIVLIYMQLVVFVICFIILSFMLIPFVIMPWNCMYNLFFAKNENRIKTYVTLIHILMFSFTLQSLYILTMLYPDLELLRYRLKQIWINGILKVIISKSSCWLIKFRLNLRKYCNE